MIFVHPFDDLDVMAGHGVAGLELLEDAEDLDAVVVPVGGGGLIGGIATAMKTMRPEVRVIGVEPTGADVMTRSLATGKVETQKPDTIADGLAAPFAGEHTLRHARARVDRIEYQRLPKEELAHRRKSAGTDAAKLFEAAALDINDVSAQNKKMRDGEDSIEDIERHVDEWISANQETFDSWVKMAQDAS